MTAGTGSRCKSICRSSPVNDLIVKKTDNSNDLVVATHGRSFWVLDDITPLEQYQESVPQQEAHLFHARSGQSHRVRRRRLSRPRERRKESACGSGH